MDNKIGLITAIVMGVVALIIGVVIAFTLVSNVADIEEDVTGYTNTTATQSILTSSTATLTPVGQGISSSSVTGKNQTWLEFDGVDDNVNLNRPFNFDDSNNNFSVCLSFTRDDNGTMILINQRDAFADGWAFQFNGNYLEGRLNTTTFLATNSIVDADWHSACLIINRNGNSSMYVDGKLASKSVNTSNIIMDTLSNITVAKKSYVNGDFFNGSIKSIYIFNNTIARTTEETTFLNDAEHLNITTYDGSNQTIHPSVLYFATPWNGYNYWMGNTPYPEGNSAFENPSIFYCNDTLYDCNSNNATWVNSTTNPINKTSCESFCSDLDIVYDSDEDFIYAYYRKFNSSTNISTEIRQNSSDGSTWSNELVIRTENKTISDIDRSCVYIYRSSTSWEKFCQNEDVNSDVIYYNSSDGINWNYNSSIEDNVFSDTNIWHLDVKWIPEKERYFMMFFTTVTSNIYFAESDISNPLNWTFYFPTEIMSKSGWNSQNLYKPAFLYNETGNDRIDLWFGGQNSSDSSFTGYSNYTYDKLKVYLSGFILNYSEDKLVDLNLNENSGTTAYDVSGSGNNGTITGAVWSDDGVDVALTAITDYIISPISGLFTLVNDDYEWSGLDVSWDYDVKKGTTISTDNLRDNFVEGVDNVSSKIPILFTIAGVILILGVLFLLIPAYKKISNNGGI